MPVLNPQKIEKDVDLTGELEDRWSNTPDFHVLKLNQFIPIFVYGTLKFGENMHNLLVDCPYLGLGETVTPCFKMKSYQGIFPILKSETRKEEIKNCEYVLGEVYAVTPKRLLHIDKAEDNGYMFQREMKHVWLPDQTFKGSKGDVKPSIKVWMYLATDFFENLEELPDVMTAKHNNRRYYNWVGAQESDAMWVEEKPIRPFNPEPPLPIERVDFNIDKMNEEFVEDYELRNGKIPF